MTDQVGKVNEHRERADVYDEAHITASKATESSSSRDQPFRAGLEVTMDKDYDA